MEERIRQIVIIDPRGEKRTTTVEKGDEVTFCNGALTVKKANVQAPAIIHGRGDEGLITSKGFQVTKHVLGKRIEFIDPNTGNCFVAKLGIDSIEPISWYGEKLDVEFWHDPDTPEIQAKRAFTKQYGMIIVPQYSLSFTEKHGLRSVAGKVPFTKRNWYESYELFLKMKLPEGVSILMIAGFEADRSLQHIIDAGEATREDITVDSKIFGGYDGSGNVYETGRKGTPCIDGVYNQTGLVRYWTQEKFGYDYRVVRAGSCNFYSNVNIAACKHNINPRELSIFWSSTGTLLFK